MNQYKQAMLDAMDEIYNLSDEEIMKATEDAMDSEKFALKTRYWAIDIMRWHMNRADALDEEPINAEDTSDDDLLSTKDAGRFLNKNPRTLQYWRRTGRYHAELPHYRIGKNCFYRRGDLRQFLEFCKVGGNTLY